MALIPKLLDRVLKMSWWTSTRAGNEPIGGIWRFLGGIYTEYIRDTTPANRIIARFQTIANAVNYITARNAATNNNPVITTSNSSDTHVGLDVQLKGDGRVKLLGNQYTSSQTAEKLVSLNNNEIRAEYDLVSGSVLADIPDDHGVRLDDDEAWLVDLYDFETCERQGYKGGISSDETYYYVCIEDNTWIRIGLANLEKDISFPEVTGDPMDNSALAAVLNLKLGEVKPADLNITIVNSMFRVPLIQSGDFQSNGVRLEINPVGLAIPRFDINGRLYTNEAALGTQVPNLGQLNTLLAGKADLADGKVPVSQLPSYVSDVIEVATFSALPATGEASKIYVTIDTNKTYRWTGSTYVEIGDGGVELGETSATAYRGDRGKTAYDHSQMTGNPHSTSFSEITGDPMDNSALAAVLNLKLEEVTPQDIGLTFGAARIPARTQGGDWLNQGLSYGNGISSQSLVQRDTQARIRIGDAVDANQATTLGQVTTLLEGKADSVHTHTVDNITGLQDELDLKLSDVKPSDLNITSLAGNIIPVVNVDGEWTNDGVRFTNNTTGLTIPYRDGAGRIIVAAAATTEQAVSLGQLNTRLTTKADLVDGKVPVSQLPSYVSDVIVTGDYSLLPATGEESKIYVTEDENKTYRWTGSAYVEIGDGGVALGETSATAYRGDRGKTAYDHSQLTSGNPHNTEIDDITDLRDELDSKLASVTPADLNCPIDNAENRIPYFVQGAWVSNGVRYVSNSAIGNTLLQRDGDGRVYFNAAVSENQGVNLGQMAEYVTDQINTIPAIQYTDDSNSNYKLTRTIVGSKIMLEVDIFIVEDLATDISFELIPLDLARFFYFQSIVQVASTTGWTLGVNGTGASELTVSFNKLLDEANPETFAMKGRQGGSPPDLEGLYGASQYILNSVSRGSMNTSYDSNRRLVKLYTSAVNMTLNTSQTKEMEIGYKLVIEGTLLF